MKHIRKLNMTKRAFAKDLKNTFRMNIALLFFSFLVTLFVIFDYYQDIELLIKHKVTNLIVLLILTFIPNLTAFSIHFQKKRLLNHLAITFNFVGIFLAFSLLSKQFSNQFIYIVFSIITLPCLINIRMLLFARIK